MPTTRPPTTPIRTVRPGRTVIVWMPPPVGRRVWRTPLATIAPAATSRTAPRRTFRRSPNSGAPIARSTNTPQNAAGTEPSASQRTRSTFTVPRRKCTLPPTGFMTTAATMSLDTADNGLTRKRRTRMGVSSAPPPIPVSPTTNPTRSPASITPSSRSIALRQAHKTDRQARLLEKEGQMRISAKADYAVRAAAELAATAPQGGPVKREQLAQAQAIPPKFLENILADLRNAGLVRSRRGAEGGYALTRAADEISVADVMRAVEGPLAAVQGVRPEALHYAGAASRLQIGRASCRG